MFTLYRANNSGRAVKDREFQLYRELTVSNRFLKIDIAKPIGVNLGMFLGIL